jgi:hypothetical protein
MSEEEQLPKISRRDKFLVTVAVALLILGFALVVFLGIF